MSWLFSQALVAEYSAANCLGGKPSAQLSGPLMPQAYSSSAKTMGFWRHSRFGMTCKPLMENLGEDVLTWFLAGFPARTSAPPEPGKESLGKAQACGSTWPASWVKYDPVLFSWKTAQPSLFGDSVSFSGTWPRWGLMRDGECWVEDTPALVMPEKEFGFVPTPQARDDHGGGMLNRGAFKNLRDWLREEGLVRMGRDRNARFWEYLMMWPDEFTALKPLEMDKFQSWLQQHGKCLEGQ
jgi:hypothetical protein